MIYPDIQKAIFLDRPNRFVAHVQLDGRLVSCHVKNTGRCRELLIPGAEIYVQHREQPARKTAYDLIAVQKKGRLVNLDSAASNRVFHGFLTSGGLGFQPERIQPEYLHGDSRFDFYFEHGGVPCMAEVKGVTLEEDGIARFPDAPTLRGLKHLNGLRQCAREGIPAYIIFVIQMDSVQAFEANRVAQPAFADALRAVKQDGVQVLAYDCHVTPDSLDIANPVPIRY